MFLWPPPWQRRAEPRELFFGPGVWEQRALDFHTQMSLQIHLHCLGGFVFHRLGLGNWQALKVGRHQRK